MCESGLKGNLAPVSMMSSRAGKLSMSSTVYATDAADRYFAFMLSVVLRRQLMSKTLANSSNYNVLFMLHQVCIFHCYIC